MSAAEVIEQIKKLSPEERREVVEYFRGANAAMFRDSSTAAPEVKYIPQDEFETMKKRVFEEHRELLHRLAQ